MALAGSTNDHDVVRSMPGCHSHSSDIILKTAGGDFCCDHRSWLRVDVSEILCRGQAHTLCKRLTHFLIGELAHLKIFHRFSPVPAPSFGCIVLKILQNFFHMELFILHKLHLLSPLNTSFAISRCFPSAISLPTVR